MTMPKNKKTPTAAEPVISIDAIHPHERNPRTINDAQFAKLCDSVKRDPEFMVLRPIVVDDKGTILGGNMRYRACVHLGMKTLPSSWVARADNLTPEQKRRFIIVDNAPDGMSGDWDDDILGADYDIVDLKNMGFDFNYNNDHVPTADEVTSQFLIVIECDNEIDQNEKLERVIKEGWSCRALTS